MEIQIASGLGAGSTPLSAFDDALQAVGIHDLNLIPLSSVVPEGATVRVVDSVSPGGIRGDRLYCVLSEHRALAHEECWAGLAWIQDETGAGVFLEEHGSDKSGVETRLRLGLDDMIGRRDGSNWGEPQFEICGRVAHDSPHSALLVAVFHREGWMP